MQITAIGLHRSRLHIPASYPLNLNPLIKLVEGIATALDPTVIHTTPEQGFDTAVAIACGNVKIPYVLHVPCLNYDRWWSEFDKKTFRRLCDKAKRIDYFELVTMDTLPSNQQRSTALELKERMMLALVERSPYLLTLWDGSEKSLSTKPIIDHAQKQDKEIINLWQIYQILLNTSERK